MLLHWVDQLTTRLITCSICCFLDYFDLRLWVVAQRDKTPIFALLGPLALLLTPRLFGDAAANHKDIPLLLVILLQSRQSILLEKKQSAKHLLVLGITFGILSRCALWGIASTLSTSSGYWCRKRNLSGNDQSIVLPRSLLYFASACLFTLFHCPTWPLILFLVFLSYLRMQNPFRGMVQCCSWVSLIHPTQLPATYIPTWFLITTPIATIVLWLASIKLVLKSKLAHSYSG